VPVSMFFLGAVIGGIPALYKKTKESSLRISSAFIFCWTSCCNIHWIIPEESINIGSGSGVVHYLMILVAGIVIALALVLPGISTSICCWYLACMNLCLRQ